MNEEEDLICVTELVTCKVCDAEWVSLHILDSEFVECIECETYVDYWAYPIN